MKQKELFALYNCLSGSSVFNHHITEYSDTAECFSTLSLLSKKALLSSLSLGREPWEEWMQSKGVTGIRAPQGQAGVRMVVVWF